MFRIVPIQLAKESGKKRGRPLHVSLSTSTHDHTDPANAGIILTVGRSGCDVNFADMDRVGWSHRHPLCPIKITGRFLEVGGGVGEYCCELDVTPDKNLDDLTWAVATAVVSSVRTTVRSNGWQVGRVLVSVRILRQCDIGPCARLRQGYICVCVWHIRAYIVCIIARRPACHAFCRNAHYIYSLRTFSPAFRNIDTRG